MFLWNISLRQTSYFWRVTGQRLGINGRIDWNDAHSNLNTSFNMNPNSSEQELKEENARIVSTLLFDKFLHYYLGIRFCGSGHPSISFLHPYPHSHYVLILWVFLGAPAPTPKNCMQKSLLFLFFFSKLKKYLPLSASK